MKLTVPMNMFMKITLVVFQVYDMNNVAFHEVMKHSLAGGGN